MTFLRTGSPTRSLTAIALAAALLSGCNLASDPATAGTTIGAGDATSNAGDAAARRAPTTSWTAAEPSVRHVTGEYGTASLPTHALTVAGSRLELVEVDYEGADGDATLLLDLAEAGLVASQVAVRPGSTPDDLMAAVVIDRGTDGRDLAILHAVRTDDGIDATLVESDVAAAAMHGLRWSPDGDVLAWLAVDDDTARLVVSRVANRADELVGTVIHELPAAEGDLSLQDWRSTDGAEAIHLLGGDPIETTLFVARTDDQVTVTDVLERTSQPVLAVSDNAAPTMPDDRSRYADELDEGEQVWSHASPNVFSVTAVMTEDGDGPVLLTASNAFRSIDVSVEGRATWDVIAGHDAVAVAATVDGAEPQFWLASVQFTEQDAQSMLPMAWPFASAVTTLDWVH